MTALALDIAVGFLYAPLFLWFEMRRQLPDWARAFLRAPAAVFWQCVRSCTSVAEIMLAIAEFSLGLRLLAWNWEPVRPWLNVRAFEILTEILPPSVWSALFLAASLTHIVGLGFTSSRLRVVASAISFGLWLPFCFLFWAFLYPTSLIGSILPAFVVGSLLCCLGIDDSSSRAGYGTQDES